LTLQFFMPQTQTLKKLQFSMLQLEIQAESDRL
jgi:hypothetical protein